MCGTNPAISGPLASCEHHHIIAKKCEKLVIERRSRCLLSESIRMSEVVISTYVDET